MMIRARRQKCCNHATKCSLNTVKWRAAMETVACRKEHNRRSDCLHTPEFTQNLQEKVMEDTGKGMQVLVQEMGITISNMNLALNVNLYYQSYKRCNNKKKKKGLRKPFDKGKETLELGETSC